MVAWLVPLLGAAPGWRAGDPRQEQQPQANVGQSSKIAGEVGFQESFGRGLFDTHTPHVKHDHHTQHSPHLPKNNGHEQHTQHR